MKIVHFFKQLRHVTSLKGNLKKYMNTNKIQENKKRSLQYLKNIYFILFKLIPPAVIFKQCERCRLEKQYKNIINTQCLLQKAVTVLQQHSRPDRAALRSPWQPAPHSGRHGNPHRPPVAVATVRGVRSSGCRASSSPGAGSPPASSTPVAVETSAPAARAAQSAPPGSGEPIRELDQGRGVGAVQTSMIK